MKENLSISVNFTRFDDNFGMEDGTLVLLGEVIWIYFAELDCKRG